MTKPDELPVSARATIRPMRDIDHAIDAYIADLARRGKTESTRQKYREFLDGFAVNVEQLDVGAITPDHCRCYLDQWTRNRPPAGGRRAIRPPASVGTLALHNTILRRFFAFLHEDLEAIPRNPMERVKRPRRKRPEDITVVSVSGDDVSRMFDACEDWQELLCLSVVAYLGPRRGAASKARRRDVDLTAGTVRFEEKGGKEPVKPMPDELAAIIRAADENHVWVSSNAYLIPNRRAHRNPERSDKIIWDTVKKLAARAGVRSHVHALRAAFAVAFDEQYPGRLIALKELLGHSDIATTMVYLRRKDRAKEMETVRGLSWGSVFPPSAVMPPTGFEPVDPPSSVPEPLRRKLEELKASKPRERT